MNKRIWILDFLRGIAILMVVAFHLVFDLNYFYDLPVSYSEGFWFYEGKMAAILFIGMVGMVSTIIQRQVPEKALWINVMRGMKLIGIGILITSVTFFLFPTATIWFGILHFMGVSLLLTLPFLRFGWMNVLMGTGVIFLKNILPETGVESNFLIPLGFPPANFSSLDYYPLLPWLGVMLMGMGLGNLLYKFMANPKEPMAWQKSLVVLGKNSLWIYLIHQPILLGILWVVF